MRFTARHIVLLVKTKLQGQMPTKDVSAAIICSYKTSAKYLRDLTRAGYLKKTERGVYEITDKGSQELNKRGIELALMKWKRDTEMLGR